MANLGDSDLSERGRVIFLTVITSGAIVLTTAAFAAVGDWELFTWFSQQSWPVNGALHLALWGTVMFGLSRLRPLIRATATAIKTAAGVLVWLPVLVLKQGARLCVLVLVMCWKLPSALLRLVLGAGYDLFMTDLRLRADPFLSPAVRIYERWIVPLQRHYADFRESRRFERSLRRAYREEFREHYPSYRAFRAAYLEQQASEQRSASSPSPDLFAGACLALGLPEDGTFMLDAFKARYRALMKVSHPDVAGNNNQAAALNAAADIIKKRKGWQ